MKRKIGDILKIKLGKGMHSYAHVSNDPLVIFYDLQTEKDLPIYEITKLPIAFKIWVLNSDIKRGVWEKIGNAELSLELLNQPIMFKQDSVTGRLALHHREFSKTNFEREATLSECKGLERAAVWEANHVIDRLRDHFNGIENKWVKSLAINEGKVPLDQLD